MFLEQRLKPTFVDFTQRFNSMEIMMTHRDNVPNGKTKRISKRTLGEFKAESLVSEKVHNYENVFFGALANEIRL